MDDLDRLQIEYQQANDWARHYSTVRMTLAPFMATTSLTIFGFAWGGSRGWPLVVVSAVVWGLGYFFLFLFTAMLERERNYAKEHRKKLREVLPKPEYNFKRQDLFYRRKMGDGAAVQAAGQEPPHPGVFSILSTFRDIPFLVGTVLTLIYIYILYKYYSS